MHHFNSRRTPKFRSSFLRTCSEWSIVCNVVNTKFTAFNSNSYNLYYREPSRARYSKIVIVSPARWWPLVELSLLKPTGYVLKRWVNQMNNKFIIYLILLFDIEETPKCSQMIHSQWMPNYKFDSWYSSVFLSYFHWNCLMLMLWTLEYNWSLPVSQRKISTQFVWRWLLALSVSTHCSVRNISVCGLVPSKSYNPGVEWKPSPGHQKVEL